MKEYFKTVEKRETWTASEWGEEEADAVAVMPPDRRRFPVIIRHEDDIEKLIPDAPDTKDYPLKSDVRREVLRHRTANPENEFRGDGGVLWQFRMVAGVVERRYTHCLTLKWGNWETFSRPLKEPMVGAEGLYAAALAFLDRHLAQQWQPVDGAEGWEIRMDAVFRDTSTGIVGAILPEDATAATVTRCGITIPEPVIAACCKLLGVERKVPLKSNQVQVGDNVYELRWNGGAEECRHVRNVRGAGNPVYAKWGSAYSLGDDAMAWFAANKPGPINDGAGWRFDDGREVEFRMRDDGEAEAFLRSNGAIQGSTVSGPAPSDAPSITATFYAFRDRERAKWCVKWGDDRVWIDGPEHKGAPVCTSFNGKWVDWHLVVIPTWVRNRAAELYRQSRQLAPDEIWMGGKVVKLEWDSARRLVVGGGIAFGSNSEKDIWWTNHTWLSDAERLAAFDRCKAYYERMTEPKKVVFEGRLVRINTNTNHQPRRGPFGDIVGFDLGKPTTEIVCDNGTTVTIDGEPCRLNSLPKRLRFTIESIEGEVW